MDQSNAPHRLHFGTFAVLAALIAGYLLLDSRLRIGPRWLYPVLLAILLVPFFIARRRSLHGRAHVLGLAIAALSSMTIASSIGILVYQLLAGDVSAENLLQDASILWIANVLAFSIWYWELDSGGPQVRHSIGYTPTDFAFPQTTLGGQYAGGWVPCFTDYLFVAFNTSSAFSPTDTLVLSHRAKYLAMAQSMMAIVSLAVLAARAINTLR